MRRVYAVLILAVLALALAPGCAPKKASETPPPRMVSVTQPTYKAEVLDSKGLTLVLFHNEKFRQAVDMRQRYEGLADKFYGKAKFCEFTWKSDGDTKPYRLETLPTVVMYRDGQEVDRIKGLPTGRAELAAFNDDMELWLLKTGLGMSTGAYQADYKYRFNNGHKLISSNY